MRGFKELIRVEKALEKLRNAITRKITDSERVSLLSAIGRICGEDLHAPQDYPPYDRSAVDGYAVIAEDTFGASPMNPMKLKVIAKLEAGAEVSELPEIRRGESVEVLTGAPIPRGATAVIPVEDVEKVGEEVEIRGQVYPGQNISRRGEDFKVGEIILRKGELIRPWHIGVAASFGITELTVLRRPKVAILSTGDELAEIGEEPGAGHIYNSTKPMLASALSTLGCDTIDLGISRDDVNQISEKITEGVRKGDLVIVTGGTSIGAHDLVPEAISKIGEVIVHGLAIRPGKPAGFGVVEEKPVFMLSGFPVAALIQFRVLVTPAIEYLLGCRFDPCPRVRGRLTRRVASPPGIRSFVRVRVLRTASGELLVEPLRLTGSGMLSTLTRGNGLLIIPEELEGYEEGDEVEVELLSPIIESEVNTR